MGTHGPQARYVIHTLIFIWILCPFYLIYNGTDLFSWSNALHKLIFQQVNYTDGGLEQSVM
jgi:hypothetical protein